MQRFGSATIDEIRQKRENISAKATKKSNAKAARALRDYLKFRGKPENFEAVSKDCLNEVLSHFYINVRKMDGGKCKVSSLENLRFGLNRHLQTDHRIDLMDEDFSKFQREFWRHPE